MSKSRCEHYTFVFNQTVNLLNSYDQWLYVTLRPYRSSFISTAVTRVTLVSLRVTEHTWWTTWKSTTSNTRSSTSSHMLMSTLSATSKSRSVSGNDPIDNRYLKYSVRKDGILVVRSIHQHYNHALFTNSTLLWKIQFVPPQFQWNKMTPTGSRIRTWDASHNRLCFRLL